MLEHVFYGIICITKSSFGNISNTTRLIDGFDSGRLVLVIYGDRRLGD
jgi:hypothetical protein